MESFMQIPWKTQRLTFHFVQNFKEFEAVRRIYNESLEHMTKRLQPNTLEEQFDWWMQSHGLKVAVGSGPEVIGYIMVTPRHYNGGRFELSGNFYTPMFAIAKEWQGKGLARQFIQHYLLSVDGPFAGEQLKSNEVIRRLNKEAGWEIVAENGGVEFLFHPGLKRNEGAAKAYLAWRSR